jgi:ribosome recycling factor
MLDTILKQTAPKMAKVVEQLGEALRGFHVGKASPQLVEDLKVNQYNTLLPIKQLASIAVAESNVILVTPWDPGSLSQIEAAVRESQAGLNTVSDGKALRIVLPPLSEERRQELTKLVYKKGEEARVALRTVRAVAWEHIKAAEKTGRLTEDDRYRGEEELNRLIAEHNDQVAQLINGKEREIMGE